MSLRFLKSNLLPCAGIIVPPVLWAVGTQAGEILPYVECTAPVRISLLMVVTAIVVSLAAGVLAWRTSPGEGDTASVFPRSFDLVRTLSLGMALTFAFTMGLQAMSALVLSGCER